MLLTLSNFASSLDTRSLSFNICGEWPSRAAEEWNGWHSNGLERRVGDGGQLFFLSPFRTFFNFLPGLRVPFQHEMLEQAEVCPRKEMVFLVYRFGSCFIPFRELVCWGQLLFALPDMVHPSSQSSGREHQSQDQKKKKFQLKCSGQVLDLVCLFVCLF